MRTIASLVAALSMMGAAVAYAEDHRWEAPEPKPVGENARCVGYADFGGHQYTYGNWVPMDPSGRDFDRRAYCHRILATDMQRYFHVRYGLDLPSSAIQVMESP